ncbi:unnamed protein product [Caenorhabditis sp. 36 PRJEB53466]|nr:unnamed protein product [Caenorhabditis sp. 36 PRJEB53466]
MRLLFLCALIAVASASIYHHHHNRRRSFQRHRVRSPAARIHVRSERKSEECQKHEHHLICGPERHCDKTCDNMFSPPQCVNTLHHAKCYFPRCVCNDGYVRDEHGLCIRPSHCPNTYYEPASMLVEGNQDNDMMIQFEPVKFSRIGNHRVLRISRKSPREYQPSNLSIRI